MEAIYDPSDANTALLRCVCERLYTCSESAMKIWTRLYARGGKAKHITELSFLTGMEEFACRTGVHELAERGLCEFTQRETYSHIKEIHLLLPKAF